MGEAPGFGFLEGGLGEGEAPVARVPGYITGAVYGSNGAAAITAGCLLGGNSTLGCSRNGTHTRVCTL